ncbi:hypothetical protein [Methylomonas sp. MgM2]
MNLIKPCMMAGLVSLLTALTIGQPARATNSTAVLNIDGRSSCGSLAGNPAMEAIDQSPPEVGQYHDVTGPDGQTFRYYIGSTNMTGDTIASWQILSPLPGDGQLPASFVVLRRQGRAGGRVFHFNSEGAISDTDEVAQGKIRSVSFCYGLADPYNPTELPACEPNLCSADTTLVLQIEEADNSDGDVQACSCEEQISQCDPSAQTGAVDSCTFASDQPQYQPENIQFGLSSQSYYCTTLNGSRYCFRK